MKNDHKIELILREWYKRSLLERQNEGDVHLFYAYLSKNNSALLNLNGINGDVYQFLKTVCKLGE